MTTAVRTPQVSADEIALFLAVKYYGKDVSLVLNGVPPRSFIWNGQLGEHEPWTHAQLKELCGDDTQALTALKKARVTVDITAAEILAAL